MRAVLLLVCACATSVAPPAREAATAQTGSLPAVASGAPVKQQSSDAVLLDAAQVERDRGDDNKARTILVELIKKSPDSHLVPDAWLALAEMSFDRADMTRAEKEYLEVVRFPPPGNLGYGYAWYKLGYVFWSDNRGDRALEAFKRVIDWSAQYPQNQGATKLRREALHDVVPVFAQFGAAARAYPFFRVLAGEDARALVMLDELASRYRDTNKIADAHSVYQELLVRDQSHVCENDVHARFTVPGANSALEDAELKKCH